jgi:vesicle coat complex subunit
MLDEHADSSLFVNCIDAIKMDLTCGHDVREALALGTLGNIGSPSLAKDLGMCVISKALSDSRAVPIYVRKKACLCLLSFLRRHKQLYNQDKWIEMIKGLFKSRKSSLKSTENV